MSATNLTALVREVLTDFPNNSDETVAIEAMNRLRVPVKAQKILLPAVEDWVGRTQRGPARDIEDRARETGALTDLPTPSRRREVPGARPVDIASERRQALKELLDSSLPELPDILWGDATRAQLDVALGRLVKKRNGIDQTIDLLQQAIATIDAAGVACLREIKDAA